jgi:hypothetical protein
VVQLTEEQIEHWRDLLITLPLPPFNLALGIYALIMPQEQIVQVVECLQELIDSELSERREPTYSERRKIEETCTNIVRTRPRKKHLSRGR